ncbi:hypothetical protein L2X99_12370 [Microbacterium sp. KUDC0406]|uniref:hypothetical protein n=1 Tax=Microbacterium sp. KUDC0406 TaxID=2909588 RepID=UPI001F36E9FF|nr:hypothetical protein [Microbacterium sp. KUDC0406]UJP09231.1 hypothetical protein L2X99_12370 [Microbacterium sp. KUDC0406]
MLTWSGQVGSLSLSKRYARLKMRTGAGRVSVALAIVVMALVGCTSVVPSQSAGDYPAYDEQSLVEASILVIEGTPVATEKVVLTPRHEGDSAKENPLLGLSDDEKKRAMDEGGVPATAVTLEVTAAHRGQAAVGDEVVIVQTDGSSSEPPLQESEHYLLFARDGFDRTYVILGGSAGMYVAVGDGSYRAVQTDAAPFESLTSTDAAALVK